LNTATSPGPRFRRDALVSHLAPIAGAITLQQALERFQRDYAPVLKVIASRVPADSTSTFLKLR
jgi:hypothetical protein